MQLGKLRLRKDACRVYINALQPEVTGQRRDLCSLQSVWEMQGTRLGPALEKQSLHLNKVLGGLCALTFAKQCFKFQLIGKVSQVLTPVSRMPKVCFLLTIQGGFLFNSEMEKFPNVHSGTLS